MLNGEKSNIKQYLDKTRKEDTITNTHLAGLCQDFLTLTLLFPRLLQVMQEAADEGEGVGGKRLAVTQCV